MLIHERSHHGIAALNFESVSAEILSDIPGDFLRETPPALPEVTELIAVRHYTNLSKKNVSVDTHFYPLGSCTMKYNPRNAHQLASLPGFLSLHPLQPVSTLQGLLSCLHTLQTDLSALTGMAACSLVPMAGAQGELAGCAMIRAYHLARGDGERNEMIVPEAAHGTNPASAAMAGMTVRTLPVDAAGNCDLAALKDMLSEKTAGLMLTNPSTLGVFETAIQEIQRLVHDAGGLLYYDGANLNAILGKVSPAAMGFDVMHFNLHKTFGTPHGGGGPGVGPVACTQVLAPFLPVPRILQTDCGYDIVDAAPQSIGRLASFMGNVGICLRAYVYIRSYGLSGLQHVAETATLNANYLLKRLQDIGYHAAFPNRRASHEFILTLAEEKKTYGITALHVAKRLLDYGVHAPTIYFPLIVPECFLIEPTETEDKATLDRFIDIMQTIRQEMKTDPEKLFKAPLTTPIRKLDEVQAARQMCVRWMGGDREERTHHR